MKSNLTVYLLLMAAALLTLVALPGSARARRSTAVRQYAEGMWSGMNSASYSTAIFEARRSEITRAHFGALSSLCFENNGYMYDWAVTLGESETQPLHIPPSGRIDVGFEVAQGAYQGVLIEIKGRLKNKRGQLKVSVHSQTEDTVCDGTTTIPVRWTRARMPRS